MAISGTCTMKYRRELRIVLITWRIYPSSCAKYLLNVNKISSEIRKTSSPKLMRSSTNNKLHSAKIMSKKFRNSISVSAKSTINYRLLQTTPIKWIMTSCQKSSNNILEFSRTWMQNLKSISMSLRTFQNCRDYQIKMDKKLFRSLQAWWKVICELTTT